MDRCQIWGLVELIFYNAAFITDFRPKLRLPVPELDCDPFLGLGTENLPKLSILNRKLENLVIFD